MNDPVADMLTRIRNALRVKKSHVNIKRSKLCLGVAKVLVDEGYISGFTEIEDRNQGLIRIELKYGEQGDPVIQNVERASKPGRRLYTGYRQVPRVLDGLGMSILSTSRGVMSDRVCRREKVGGELLCTVW
jgi:small subunit ribosomal protein S8